MRCDAQSTCKVKLLRVRGASKSEQKIQSNAGVVGHITIATVGATREMKLHVFGDDARRAALIPLLFDPTLQAMHSGRMLLVGWELHSE